MITKRVPARLLSAALVLALLLQFAAPLLTSYAEEPELPPPPAEKAGRKTGAKLHGRLKAIAHAYEQGGAPAAAEAAGAGQPPSPSTSDDKMRVVLEAEPGQRAGAEAAVSRLGGEVEGHYGDLVQALLPHAALNALDHEGSIRYARPPYLRQPDVTSEGRARTGIPAWHAQGMTGAGTKVAIVDLGFEGYQALLGSELPASVTPRCFCGTVSTNIASDTQHGTGVAEIVHDMAPDAQLYLIKFNTEIDLSNAVDYLITEGVQVVNHSIGWFHTGGGDGTGVINDIVARARANNIVWVNSAGNYADRYWEGTWSDPDSNSYHNFSGSDESNNITIPSGSCVDVLLAWNNWPVSNQDYDLFLYDASMIEVASSEGPQSGTHEPVEWLTYCAPSTGSYHIKILRYAATQAVKFRLFVLHARPEYFTPSGSLTEPADSPNVLTAGAVAYSEDIIEYFSSQGPTQDGRTKPDLVGLDGVSTVAYGTAGFYGTSASSPHIAGAMAVVRAHFTTVSPADAQAWMEQSAADMGTKGKDNVFGSGMVNFTSLEGSLDATFGRGGVAATDVGSGSGTAYALALQTDDKIVAAGYAANGAHNDFALTRSSMTGGALDTSFGGGGKVTTDFGGGDDVAHAVAVQPDGKTVAAGYATLAGSRRFALARYLPGGSLDPGFGSGGTVTTAFGDDDFARALALQPDGNIVAAGFAASGSSYDFALARYLPDGSLDPGFGNGGKVTTDFGSGDGANALALYPDGSMAVAGRSGDGNAVDFALARYTAAGVLDASFGSGGKVTTDFVGGGDAAQGLALQPDDKIVAAGYATSAGTLVMALARYSASGVLDGSFGSGGRVTTPTDAGSIAYGLALQADGKILAAGDAAIGSDNDHLLVRYTASGGLDASFAHEGKVTVNPGGNSNSATALAVQLDGKVLVGGSGWNGSSNQFAIARYVAFTPGQLELTAPFFSTPESEHGEVSVRRTGGVAGAVSVTVSTTTGGTATPGADYTTTSTTLTWPSGDHLVRRVTVPVANDLLTEPGETVQIVLSSPVGATLGLATTATLTISDDDLPVGNYASAVLGDAPAAYWRLDETSAATGSDWSGNGNHGGYSGGYTLGVPDALPLTAGAAVQFDGVSGIFSVGDAPALSPTTAVSVEAWVNLTAYSGSYPRLLSKPGSYELTMYTGANADGRLEWKVSLVGGDVLVSTLYADRLLLGQWYHVAATYDGANLRVYINGVQKASKPASGAIKDSTNVFTISRADRPIAAKLDEVAVYGAALAPARLSAHYNTAIPAVALTSGNNQTRATGATLDAPFVVTVTDSDSSPVAGMTVTWEITSTPPAATGQTLAPAGGVTTTNGSGQASATLTLGDRAGTYTVRATATAPSGQTLRGPSLTFTATAQTASPYAQAVLADAPRGYWRLNEASGTQAGDLSGNSGTGAYLNGVTLGAAGALPDETAATAITLDGVNDAVAFPDSPLLSPASAVSVEAWVKLTAYSGSYPRLLSKPGSYELTMYTGANADGRLEWKVSLASGDVLVNTVYADRLLLGQWYHVAATYDGSNLRVFINGVQKAVKAATGAVKDGTSAFTISRTDRPIAASMDEVAVYGAALSQARVLAHHEAVVPPTPPSQYVAAVSADSPAAYWRLNEASGPSAADGSGNSNTGTYTNGVLQGVTGALTSESDAAAQFDGVNDFVRVPDAPGLSPTAAVTVEAWVNLTAYSGSYPRLLSKPGSYELTMYTGANADGRLEWKVSLASGDVLVNTVYADRLLLGQWYHVAATYDGVSLRIYVNGVQKAVKAATGAVKDGTSAFTISRADRAIAAKLDEVAVYGTALPPARVQAHYAAR